MQTMERTYDTVEITPGAPYEFQGEQHRTEFLGWFLAEQTHKTSARWVGVRRNTPQAFRDGEWVACGEPTYLVVDQHGRGGSISQADAILQLRAVRKNGELEPVGGYETTVAGIRRYFDVTVHQ